jgi:glycerol-3-phosphate dehydrogenase subunit B
MCQRTQVAGDLRRLRGRVAVAAFSGHLGFDAGLVAAGVARLTGAGGPEATAIEVPWCLGPDEGALRPVALARALEAPGAAEALGAALRQAIPARTVAVLLPPVLGLEPTVGVVERIAAAAGVPVAEVVSDPPSVPGLRLDAALLLRLRAAGVEVVEGDLLPGGGPGRPAVVGDAEVLARAWVVATGRFVGGGVARRGALVEPLLGLSVQASEPGASSPGLAARPPASLTVKQRRAAQPLLAAGVRVDASCRPLGEDGLPVSYRLFAAGAIIGGHEHAADGTGLGVGILSGWLAGRGAAGV